MTLTSPTVDAPSPAAASVTGESIFGQTVGDARVLLKRAQKVMIFYPNGRFSGCVIIGKKALASALKRMADTEDMPCELGAADLSRIVWLKVGNYDSIITMNEARKAAAEAGAQ